MADDTDLTELDGAHWAALGSLMADGSIRKAAKAANVSERTLYRWLKMPAFAAVYRDLRREATQAAVARLQQASSSAADRLVRLLSSSKPAIALQAARTILEFSIKAVELEDLAARLAALEAAYAAKL